MNGTINPQSVMIANDDPATRAEEQAVSNFSKGMNCAQSVFLVFASQYGIEPAIALRLSAAMARILHQQTIQLIAIVGV